MRPVGCVILLSVVGAALAATTPKEVKSLCEREECTCQERDGLEHVTCDCGGNTQPLPVGDPSQAHVSDRTGSLRVRRCGQVSLVSEALSGASRLSDLELSDIGQLQLQPSCLYRAGDGPPRRITVQRVADLRLDPLAFRRVARLQQLEFVDVNGELPLGSFPDDAEVSSFRLADSRMGNFDSVLFNVSKAESITISNCSFSSLDVTARDLGSAMIVDNKFDSLFGMRFNSSKGPEMTDADVMIARNNISSLGVGQLKMALRKLTVINNTFGTWSAPLRVTYHVVEFIGNDFSQLYGSVFKELVPVANGSGKKNTFTFSRNTLRGSYMTGGFWGSFLTPVSAKSRRMVLFRVSENRFSCICWELRALVKNGEKLLNDTELVQPAENGLYESRVVHGQLYRTSTCLEDGRSLQQYRQDAYTEDLECLPSGAAAITGTVTLLTLLLAAAVTRLAV